MSEERSVLATVNAPVFYLPTLIILAIVLVLESSARSRGDSQAVLLHTNP